MPAKSETETPAAMLSPEQLAAMSEIMARGVGKGIEDARRGGYKAYVGDKLVQEARAAQDPANYDSAKWRKFRPTVNACPSYKTRKKDGHYDYFHPRFRPGEEILLPCTSADDPEGLTAKLVYVGQLEQVDEGLVLAPGGDQEPPRFMEPARKK